MDEELQARLRRWLRAENAPAVAVAAVYLMLGALWIALSDRALAAVVSDPAQLTVYQTYKGWAFVLVTSGLLYLMVWLAFRLRTRHVEAEAEVSRFLTTLLKNIPGTAYRCRNDPDWTMEYVSHGVAPLTGYSTADFVQKARMTWAELIEPEDRERVWETVQAALERRGPFRMEYRIRTRAGQRKWVWEQGRGVYDEKGELRALEGFISDITARKTAEEQLQARLPGTPRIPMEPASEPSPSREAAPLRPPPARGVASKR